MGSKGYKVAITIGPGAAWFVASKGHAGAMYRSETVRVTGNHLYARIGRLGVVNVVVHPRHVIKRAGRHRGCEKDQLKHMRDAVFVGRIAFRGEEGFTRVAARRAHGTIADLATSVRRVCRSKSPAQHANGGRNGQGPPSYGLKVTGLKYSGTVVFTSGSKAFTLLREWAVGVVPLRLGELVGRGIPFAAQSFEVRHGMSVVRVVATVGGEGSFSVEGGGTLAAVAPPPPFEGVGNFRLCEGYPYWYGTLTVSLPGRRNLRLTGPYFTPDLEPSPGCAQPSG